MTQKKKKKKEKEKKEKNREIHNRKNLPVKKIVYKKKFVKQKRANSTFKFQDIAKKSGNKSRTFLLFKDFYMADLLEN